MNWLLWVLMFAVVSVPILTLLADRALDVPAPAIIGRLGWPALLVLVGLILWGWAIDHPILRVVGWGAVGGLLGTAALDAVRLVGVKLGLFPLDMPMMFGLIALNHAPQMQRNVMGELIAQVATWPDEKRQAMLRPRMEAIARLPAGTRRAVMAAMLNGMGRLPPEDRTAMQATQMSVLTDLDSGPRRQLMHTMDELTTDVAAPASAYGQPRGLPKLPMQVFRELASKALPRTIAESRHTTLEVASWGYLWHVLNGVSFGVHYTLLVGRGSWGLALAWGGFVWLAMMAAMPRMMPVIRFPGWFPIWPAIAHIAMAIPIGAVALAWLAPADSHSGSLLGLLTAPG